MRGNSPVRFGKRPTEKDPNHGHLAGGLFHSVGARGEVPPGHPTKEPADRPTKPRSEPVMPF
jgi:hypothetical protein